MDNLRGTVVVVDDDPAQRAILARWLGAAGHDVLEFPDGESCLRGLSASIPDAVCLDLRLPGMNGLEVLARLKERSPRVPIIMLTVDDALEPVVAAVRLGAFEYLRKPVTRERLLTTVRNAVERSSLELRLAQLESSVEGWGHANILGQSAPMLDLFRQMDRAAPSDVSVLIHGESGTGKELVARALHDASGRARGPFVAVNCSAIPEGLQESELFGHERGAFTGAHQRRQGFFEQAHDGTLFLDEIAELSPGLQAKLLRALQEQRFRRVGGTKEIHSDFRLLAATHRDLGEEVRQGRFREDLYFRLAVLVLRVPPLRERGEDIGVLAARFAHDVGREAGREVTLSEGALDQLLRHSWPGNVRELQNAIQRAVVLSSGTMIEARHLPEAVRTTLPEVAPPVSESRSSRAPSEESEHWANAVPDQSLHDIEREVIEALTRRHDGNLSAVARVLGISRSTLYRKLGR
ncbi:MAG: sigma-54 dependent transcriptional regulator [Gemmatimonadota bacterium]